MQPLTLTLKSAQEVGHTAPNPSTIIIEVDMESDPATEGTQEATVIPSDYQMGVHQQYHPRPTPHRRRQAARGENWRTSGNGMRPP